MSHAGPARPSVKAARRRVVLWRHGRTSWNVQRRFQGHSDIPLDEVGQGQANRAAALLASLQPDLLACSDLLRARQTVAPLARLTGLEAVPDKVFRETDGGRFEGLYDWEIEQKYSSEHAVWRSGDPDAAVGGTGESRRTVATRIAAGVERIREELPANGLAVVATHGGCARLGIAALIGLPLELATHLGVQSNCAWSMLSEHPGGGWTLVEHNAGTLPEPVTVEEG